MSAQDTLQGDQTVQLAADGREVAGPGELPRLLKHVPERGALSLERHVATHGALPLAGGGRRSRPSALLDLVEQAGLRGRGGAAFPTATKLRAVASSRGRPIVVVNAAESEPASRKDRTLLESLPHLVLDGGQLVAEALGANQLIVAVCRSAPDSASGVAQATAERAAALREPAEIHTAAVPSDYVAGQETALVSHLNGGPALPSFTPPLPFQRGVARRPTLVANVETLAHIALIARHGARWFRELGTPAQPGSALVTLSGPIAWPGVYEIEQGASLSALIEAAGGALARPRALLLGGYGGSWIDASVLDAVALSDEHLAPRGAALGAGVVALLSENACPVAETARVTRWLADQSTGQCGPCVHGLGAIATSVQELAGGVGDAGGSQRTARLASIVRRRGACGHPDGAANFVLSALDTFATEFADHAQHGPCDACSHAGELPLPARTRELPTRRKPIAVR